jgi:hypothetical protein
MAESEERPPTKILVRAANGDLWLIRKGGNPDKKHSYQDPPPAPKDPVLVDLLERHDRELADHFGSANPGVKLQIAVVDLDAPS